LRNPSLTYSPPSKVVRHRSERTSISRVFRAFFERQNGPPLFPRFLILSPKDEGLSPEKPSAPCLSLAAMEKGEFFPLSTQLPGRVSPWKRTSIWFLDKTRAHPVIFWSDFPLGEIIKLPLLPLSHRSLSPHSARKRRPIDGSLSSPPPF